MATLIIGPSSVGKSTFLTEGHAESFGVDTSDIMYGYQAENRKVNPNIAIHYNMVHGALYEKKSRKSNGSIDFLKEQNFRKLINSTEIQECFVLVSPTEELFSRISERIEDDTGALYENENWLNALAGINFFQLYEDLFDLLEEKGISYRVLFSTHGKQSHFLESDRVYVNQNLRNGYIEPPSRQEVEKAAIDPRFEYQQPRLPFGIKTSSPKLEHLSAGRHQTFQKVLRERLDGSSVLDIGSALGDLIFTAERLGATELVGIELKESRHAAACHIAKILASKAEFHNLDFLSFDNERSFDHVYMLNVIHHIRDFDLFIRKAARTAKKSLTIEFPIMTDRKFREAHGLSRLVGAGLNRLPVIGMSSMARADQTYVFAPTTIRNLVLEEIGEFRVAAEMKSPIRDRVIMSFNRQVGPFPAKPLGV